jgi:hypothetical protein
MARLAYQHQRHRARLIRPVEQVFKPTRPEWIAHRDFPPI